METSQPNLPRRPKQLILAYVQTNNEVTSIAADIVADTGAYFGNAELLITLPEDTSEFCLSEKHIEQLYTYFHNNKHYVEP